MIIYYSVTTLESGNPNGQHALFNLWWLNYQYLKILLFVNVTFWFYEKYHLLNQMIFKSRSISNSINCIIMNLTGIIDYWYDSCFKLWYSFLWKSNSSLTKVSCITGSETMSSWSHTLFFLLWFISPHVLLTG